MDDWLAFHALSPITEDRNDLLFAMLQRTIASCHCKKPPETKDFLPPWHRQSKKKASLRDWVLSVGKRTK